MTERLTVYRGRYARPLTFIMCKKGLIVEEGSRKYYYKYSDIHHIHTTEDLRLTYCGKEITLVFESETANSITPLEKVRDVLMKHWENYLSSE
jgi:hypothetical protein